MHIVQVFNGEVPPRGYGGIERVIYWLSRELLNQGHQVTVIAGESSEISKDFPQIRFYSYGNLESLPDEALNNVDIVHFHNEVEASWADNYPYLVTEHGNSKKKTNYDRNTVFLSKSHALNHNAKYYLPNGIPVQDYPIVDEKKSQIAYMAKLNWRAKNAKTAINLAFDTNTILCLTGGELKHSNKVRGRWLLQYPWKKHLLKEYGTIDGESKFDVLGNSMCLFYLVNWHEPFALAPHEALACGTPVLATPNGALKEYIKPGWNGFLVETYAQAIEAIKQLKQMNAEQWEVMSRRCRESAYTIEQSVKLHIEMYQKVIREKFLYTEQEAMAIGFTNPPAIKIKKPLL